MITVSDKYKENIKNGNKFCLFLQQYVYALREREA